MRTAETIKIKKIMILKCLGPSLTYQIKHLQSFLVKESLKYFKKREVREVLIDMEAKALTKIYQILDVSLLNSNSFKMRKNLL